MDWHKWSCIQSSPLQGKKLKQTPRVKELPPKHGAQHNLKYNLHPPLQTHSFSVPLSQQRGLLLPLLAVGMGME